MPVQERVELVADGQSGSMFFYISFLRPPPTQTSLNSPILITPQIANDLRTEYSPHDHNIYYTWIDTSGTSASGLGPGQPSYRPLQKLTTWNPSNPYSKPIPVPPPPAPKGKSGYCLALSCDPSSVWVDFTSGDQSSPLPFPVLSVPITFVKGKPSNGKKQESIERVYRLFEESAGSNGRSGMILKITEQTSFDLDKKVWDSGVGLSSWLVGLLNSNSLQAASKNDLISALLTELKQSLSTADASNIIELGAGTGIVSSTLAALRSSILRRHLDPISPSDNAPVELLVDDVHKPSNGRLITTDLPSALPLLKHNITRNHTLFDIVQPEALVLDWDHCEDFILPSVGSQKSTSETDQDTNSEPSANTNILWDVIIMADVTYNTSSFPALVRTLSMLLAPSKSSNHPTLLLLGYKQRDPSERMLFEMAKQELDVNFVRVGSRDGWPGSGMSGGTEGEEVEIWLAKVG